MATIRLADRPGDLGWVVMAHGEIYHRQFGWSAAFEAMVAGIVAAHDPERDALWIAEHDGSRVGCVAVMASDVPSVARLRVLLVTPEARGLGVGNGLVRQALDFARAVGYEQVTLWTVAGLSSARRIYEAAGFTLVAEEPHPGFGQPVTGQTWTLALG